MDRDETSKPINPDELPMLAPCRDIGFTAPLRWLKLGWNDLRSAPGPSLVFGVITLVLTYLITLATWIWGNLGLYLGLVSGFVFVGPGLAMVWYAISRRLERGLPVAIMPALKDALRAARGALFFAVILIVVLLVWARAANTMYIFFPAIENPSWRELVVFLTAGSAVGALFSLVVFAASAFSLPMLLDRQADAVTAVITSINAVLRNKRALLLWAVLIVAAVLIGVVTAWLAFLVIMPLLGHATWHGYRQTIDAGQWPDASD